MSDNLYEILEIQKDSSINDIKKAYKNKVKIHHPDKGGNPENFNNIKNAYDILSDPKTRKIYDEQGMKGFDRENMPDFYDIFNQDIFGQDMFTSQMFQNFGAKFEK
jgi:DnaJ-class molecular chaperone